MSKKIPALAIFIFTLGAIAFFVEHQTQTSLTRNQDDTAYQLALSVSSEGMTISQVQESNSPSEGTLLFAGDTMLARTIGEKIEMGIDPFEHVSDTLDSSDFTIVNLETAVTIAGSPTPGKLFTFNAPVSSLPLLKEHGIDAVSLANNHAGDYGVEGLVAMLALLDDNEIDYIGAGNTLDEAGEPLLVTVGGTNVAILAYSNVETPYIAATETQPGLNWMSSAESFSQISTAKQIADVVIVFPHWGYEYDTYHSHEQEMLGHAMIESGADLVIGGHPHVRQDEEEYLHGKIIYSIGNFVFDSMVSFETSRGNLVQITVKEGKISSINLVPYTMNNEGFPVLD